VDGRVQLQPVGARSDLEGAFSAMARERAQAVLVLASPAFFAERQSIAELALVWPPVELVRQLTSRFLFLAQALRRPLRGWSSPVMRRLMEDDIY
jgi:hypothetical protein